MGRVGGLIDFLDDRYLQEGSLLLHLIALAALGGAFLVPFAGNEDRIYAVGKMVVYLTNENKTETQEDNGSVGMLDLMRDSSSNYS